MRPMAADEEHAGGRGRRTLLATVVLLAMSAITVSVSAAPPASDGSPDSARSASADERTSIRPHPDSVRSARGRLPRDGCFLSAGETRSPACVYGDRSSTTRVVLFGDSHAAHYHPALDPIARQRGWRLVVLTKAGCPPMPAVKRGARGKSTECGIWRRRALRRIEARERPDMVITGGSMNYRIFGRDGEQLDERATEEGLEESYVDVLERLRGAEARTVVMKDVPKASYDVPRCVAASMDRPRDCAFPLPEGHANRFDARAAAAVGADLVDVTPRICRNRSCRAVIRRILVYRTGSHLTAPFARTLRASLERQLLLP